MGTGPAGSVTAALLAGYGVANMVMNRCRCLSNTPRAHITNQRTMEVLRDLGPEVEAEAMMHASPQELMGEKTYSRRLLAADGLAENVGHFGTGVHGRDDDLVRPGADGDRFAEAWWSTRLRARPLQSLSCQIDSRMQMSARPEA